MHAPGQGSQALPGIQSSLHLISFIDTQLIVTLAHSSPPVPLDHRCFSSFWSAPCRSLDQEYLQEPKQAMSKFITCGQLLLFCLLRTLPTPSV